MTNNKQQTAVDVAELAMKLYPFSNTERNAFITGYNKAKEMEKERIIQAYSNAWHDGQDAIIMTIEHIDKGGDERGLKYYEQL
jgi:hypothetical protein